MNGVTIVLGPLALGVLCGFVAGLIVAVFGFLVLGAYGHTAWGVHVSPVVARGLQSAFRTMAYSAAGVVVANLGNWAASLLVHYGIPPEAATAVGLVLGGAVSGGHQSLQMRAQLRKGGPST